MSRHPGWDGSDLRKAAGEVRGESGEPRPAGAREVGFLDRDRRRGTLVYERHREGVGDREGAARQVAGTRAMGAGASLEFQWLRCHASTAGGIGSIPGQGTKIPHATQSSQKKKKKTD